MMHTDCLNLAALEGFINAERESFIKFPFLFATFLIEPIEKWEISGIFRIILEKRNSQRFLIFICFNLRLMFIKSINKYDV